MKRTIVSVFLFFWVVSLGGCACVKQGVKGFLAISTKEIEDARAHAIVKVVDYNYGDCYRMVEDGLIEIGSYIYAKKKDLIAVYISSDDTTPAGIFFKEINGQKTQLEIASPAKDTKEYLADKIFTVFLER